MLKALVMTDLEGDNEQNDKGSRSSFDSCIDIKIHPNIKAKYFICCVTVSEMRGDVYEKL